jgi:RNA polymerase sigma factor (sigma-70 family)
MTPRHLLAPARLAGSKLLGTQSDERLVDLFRAGSEPAFEAIVSRYRSPLLRYCSALLGRERAEDVVQQAFVNAHDAMRRDDRPLRLRPWLYRIAHNLAHNALRDGALHSRALRDEPLGDEGLAADQPELELERRARLRAVLASVQELPARQRDALVLRELEGRSYEEIASALGVGGGAVRQLLNRARTTLRTAATAVTPVGLLLRLPGSGARGGGEALAARVAELTGAAGSGAVAAKVAATALVTGAVAGGAAVAPLGDSGGEPPRERPAAVAPAPGNGARPPTLAPTSAGFAGAGGGEGMSGDRGGGGDRDSSGPGSGDRDGDGDSSSNSGPGSDSSGSGPSGDGSDSSGPGSDSSGSGSGSSGSGSGSSGSGSGSSGSGSGSGSSGSGSPGSGSGSGYTAPDVASSGSGSESPTGDADSSGSGPG